VRGLAILFAIAACGGGDAKPPNGASLTVDGTALEMPFVMASIQAGFLQLSAGTDDGTLLAISFPDDTAAGPHRCDDGPQVGLVVMEFTDGAGTRHASIFPTADPAHDCSFEIVAIDSFLELADIAGPLATSDGSATVTLTAGSFVSPIAR
jgi:hypothetical protein